MKILYLAPPAANADRLTNHTFIDEEIHGLCEAGIEAFYVSPTTREDAVRNGVHVKALPPGNSARERIRAIPFVADHLRDLGVRSYRDFRKAYHNLRVERFVADVVETHEIDVIHSHFGWPGGHGGLLAAKSTATPVLATFRGMDLVVDHSIDYGVRREASFDRAVRMLATGADHTLYFSEFMRRQGVALGASADASSVVRKGVDVDSFRIAPDRQEAREELDIHTPMILTVAGLIPRKGIDHILQGLARIRDSHDFTLVVCGEGPELQRLQELSAHLSLQNRVRFVGRVSREKIPGYFAACDVFVLASLLEAAGNVLLEAMAAGRPVVCTDSGGPPEYVDDGRTGFVVPTADPEGLASRIAFLLDHPKAADSLGREGRRRAETEYPYSNMISAITAVYDQLAGDRQMASPPGPRTVHLSGMGDRSRRTDRAAA